MNEATTILTRAETVMSGGVLAGAVMPYHTPHMEFKALFVKAPQSVLHPRPMAVQPRRARPDMRHAWCAQHI